MFILLLKQIRRALRSVLPLRLASYLNFVGRRLITEPSQNLFCPSVCAVPQNQRVVELSVKYADLRLQASSKSSDKNISTLWYVLFQLSELEIQSNYCGLSWSRVFTTIETIDEYSEVRPQQGRGISVKNCSYATLCAIAMKIPRRSQNG